MREVHQQLDSLEHLDDEGGRTAVQVVDVDDHPVDGRYPFVILLNPLPGFPARGDEIAQPGERLADLGDHADLLPAQPALRLACRIDGQERPAREGP